MIIVSQDKKALINWNRVAKIWIDKETERCFEICADGEDLGEYATEERAKEVLEEIIENMLNKSNISIGTAQIATNVSSEIYRMPKE